MTMQTFYKSYQYEHQARKRRDILEKETGVKWDYYSARGGYNFTPILTRSTPSDPSLASKLQPFLTVDYQKFISLSEQSGLSLPDTLIAAQTLIKANQAVGGVNRMGNFAFIRNKYSWEK